MHASATVVSPAPDRSRDRLPPIAAILRGEWLDTPLGHVFVRDQWFPLDHLHGALAVRAPLDACPQALADLLKTDAAPHASRLAFFDIETTGLSGGTGTYVILAGLGSFEASGADGDLAFRLRQYFLADIAEERAMLALLAEDFARFDGVVTYNGRAFDMPFVEARMTLGRVAYSSAHLAHFDLLHSVRSLYRHRMPACRLSDAERRLLRIERFDDIPGSLIPALYFDYVRAGRAAPLRGVFSHNAEDVLSLTGVLAAIASLLSSDDPDPEDGVALGRWWERQGDRDRAAALYRRALPWLEGGDDWSWAAQRHAALCMKAGEWAEGSDLWHRLWASGDRAAGLALAKYLEHRARDLPAAEEVTRRLLVRCPDRERIHLEHRLARLVRKLTVRTSEAPRRSGAIPVDLPLPRSIPSPNAEAAEDASRPPARGQARPASRDRL